MMLEAAMGSLAFKDGKVIASPLGKGKGKLEICNVPGSVNSLLSNVYNLRSVLEHESRHQVQISIVTTFNSYKEYKYFIENDAVKFQINSGKWFGKSTKDFQLKIRAYPDKFK